MPRTPLCGRSAEILPRLAWNVNDFEGQFGCQWFGWQRRARREAVYTGEMLTV
jgi:hypothetical protein